MTTGAEKGEIAEVGSPVAVPIEPVVDGDHAWRWTTISMITATGLLAVLNAAALTDWLDERAPTATIERLRQPVEAWRHAVSMTHLEGVHAHVHRCWDNIRAARFGNEQPGEPGAQ